MSGLCAIILAAGKGVRMKSSVAKVLHPVLGRPMVSWPVAAAREAGAARVVVVVGHQGDEVAKAVGGEGIEFAGQPEQRGTADAVAKSAPALEGFAGTALILCGDVPLLTPATLSALLAAHRERGALATVLTMVPPDPTGYGRVVADEAGRPVAIVEEKDADAATRALSEVNTGTYAVELPWLWEAIGGIGSDNAQGEFYLTDIIAAAAKAGRSAMVRLADPDEAMGINSREQLSLASLAMRARINRKWMAGGVTLEDPATTWIEPGVLLSPDVTLGPNVRLEGATKIAPGCRIDAGAIIKDSTLEEGAHVKPYCVLNEAYMGPGSDAGPFAHLRPGAELMASSRVGNFVEVKKARLGVGAKANHLTYLGDAEIGEKTNVGAGTITCNYDGANKFRTVIGKRAFIGSNTALVAPVRVGDDAVVAAGSTVTADVPDGALGVGRSRQKNIEGWKGRTPTGRKE